MKPKPMTTSDITQVFKRASKELSENNRNQLKPAASPERTGLSVNYYKVLVAKPLADEQDPYTAECLDIALALEMTIEEFNIFKAIWRTAAERTLGLKKAGHEAKYDAEKMVFFSKVNLRRYQDDG